MVKIFVIGVAFFLTCAIARAEWSVEDDLNLFCLKESYPEVAGASPDASGRYWLDFANGSRVPYSGFEPNGLDVDVKTSMAEPYPLEPQRTTPENSPGRKRSYAFMAALYGESPAGVRQGLKTQALLGRRLSLAAPAALAFGAAVPDLERYAAQNPAARGLLKVDGGFYWRKIAGEEHLSAHSFGIAVDLSANKAPYWRWSRQNPHPMQATYSPEIVKTMEDRGFIWGGKWREYDLMHFEYRPELICKASAKIRRRFPPGSVPVFPAIPDRWLGRNHGW